MCMCVLTAQNTLLTAVFLGKALCDDFFCLAEPNKLKKYQSRSSDALKLSVLSVAVLRVWKIEI